MRRCRMFRSWTCGSNGCRPSTTSCRTRIGIRSGSGRSRRPRRHARRFGRAGSGSVQPAAAARSASAAGDSREVHGHHGVARAAGRPLYGHPRRGVQRKRRRYYRGSLPRPACRHGLGGAGLRRRPRTPDDSSVRTMKHSHLRIVVCTPARRTRRRLWRRRTRVPPRGNRRADRRLGRRGRPLSARRAGGSRQRRITGSRSSAR